MAKYATYSETLDSGVEWLGHIPTDWRAMPIAALLEERGETNKGIKTENVLSVLRNVGVIPYEEKGDIGNKKSEDIERYKIVHPGDLVVNSMNVIIGSVGVSAYYGSLSPVYMVLKPRHKKVIHKNFVGYAFQIKTFQRWLKRLGYGILEHRLRIPLDNLKREYLPVPSYETQEQIAAFLDHETAKIDRLIAKQERLIDLLKEKRQAVISHAVTKGLNPDAPMKDSDVEWLGEVPAHWTRSSPGKVCSVISKGTTPSEQSKYQDEHHTIPFLIVENLSSDGALSEENLVFIPETVHRGFLARSRVFPGDVLFNIVGPPLGKVGVVTDSFPEWNLNQAIAFFRPVGVLNAFLSYWLQSDFCNSWFWLNARKTSGQANLTLEMCRSVPLLVPPTDEQQEIVAHCDHIVKHVNSLLSACEKQSKLLQEHRTALISAAVTGKIDVRGWQKPDIEPAETAAAVSA